MKKTESTLRFSRLAMLAFTIVMGTRLAFAQELTGYDIAKRADEVDKGDTSSYTATMTLTDKKGAKRVREVQESHTLCLNMTMHQTELLKIQTTGFTCLP